MFLLKYIRHHRGNIDFFKKCLVTLNVGHKNGRFHLCMYIQMHSSETFWASFKNWQPLEFETETDCYLWAKNDNRRHDRSISWSHWFGLDCCTGWKINSHLPFKGQPGTNVMIFKIFSKKKMAFLCFFCYIGFAKKLDHNIGFYVRKNAIFRLIENCDHNIGPSRHSGKNIIRVIRLFINNRGQSVWPTSPEVGHDACLFPKEIVRIQL
jgi:hypothetical protein